MRASIVIKTVNNRNEHKIKCRLIGIGQRAAKGNDAVPSAIATYATTLYSEKDTKETEIGNLDTLLQKL